MAEHVYFFRLQQWKDSFADYPNTGELDDGKLVYDYIINNLLPLWMKCAVCKQWRLIPLYCSSDAKFVTSEFVCSKISQYVSCATPEDERVAMALQRFKDNKFHIRSPGLLLHSPLTFLCSTFPPSLLGIAPPPLLYEEDEEEKFADYRLPFTIPHHDHAVPGVWCPTTCFRWESSTYRTVLKYGQAYLAVRNTIIYLWNCGEFHMVTVDQAAEQIIIRGLIRIVIVEEWLPNILAHFTDRCLINVGRCVEPQQTGEGCDRACVLVGPIDLKSATIYRQVINSLEIRGLNDRNSVLYSTLPNLPSPPEFSSHLFTSEIPIPVRTYDFSIANHVIAPTNNYTMIFAKQMNLYTSTQELPTLFQRGIDGTVRVFPDHAEQARALANRLFYVTMRDVRPDNSPDNVSIQKRMDSVCAELIDQLRDPAEFPLDIRFIEYFYACIEEHLIELILSSGEEETVPITASLCNLSAIDLYNYLRSKGGFYLHTLRLLSKHFLPREFIEPGAYHAITRGLGPGDEVKNTVRCIVATYGDLAGLYTLDGGDPELHRTHSVVVTVPSSRLKVIFCDNPVEEALERHQKEESLEILQIFLPHHFRMNSRQNEEAEKPKAASPLPQDTEISPLYMTVTLMYRESWWRSILCNAGSWDRMYRCYQATDLDEIPLEFAESPGTFAFIPKSRKERGFCHYFEDISPPDLSCGIIQTCIFGAHLCDEWAEDDEECAIQVDKFLKQAFNTNSRKSGKPLEYHVKRLYPPSAPSGTKNGPQVEIRSENQDLMDETRAVGFNADSQDADDAVELTDVEFTINAEWWRMLSEVASIHVLPELTTVCRLTEPLLNELYAVDFLTKEVLTGLKWSKYVLTELTSKDRTKGSMPGGPEYEEEEPYDAEPESEFSVQMPSASKEAPL
ncbi:hypothetical protein Aperf_G00000082419 [Anoplocephala perfoliata]